MPRLERALAGLPEIIFQGCDHLGGGPGRQGNGRAASEGAEVRPLTLADDPLMVELLGDNIRRALANGTVDGEIGLGIAVARYLNERHT